jgi:crotonobetainyl-CoA:carnitine CoA-transferase CaiB-like acyl-CoA transferase
MAKLGLDYLRLAARNPALIMVSGSVFGQSGPLANEWGIDGTGAALSGRTYLTGWPDRGPVIPGAVPYGDVIVPYVMAAATAAALERRRRNGVGEHIDAAMYEICAQQMYAAIEAASRGERPQRQGNADPVYYHQGVYPAKGEDRWIALSCATAAEWGALCTLASIDAQLGPAERDGRIADWTREQHDAQLVNALQAQGIAAGVVQDIEDLVERDPQLAFRGALVKLDHPLLGPFGHVRTPLSFSRSAIQPYRAPELGEHTDEIARLAGLSTERIAQLHAHGVFK